VKLSVGVLCGSMIPAGLVVGWGPCNDKSDALALLMKTDAVAKPAAVFADAGYDAEWVHRFCRDVWETKSFIPPAVHRADGQINGKYCSQMTPTRLKCNHYTRRWIVESFMSAVKRTMDSTLQARKTTSLFREAAIRSRPTPSGVNLQRTSQSGFQQSIRASKCAVEHSSLPRHRRSPIWFLPRRLCSPRSDLPFSSIPVVRKTGSTSISTVVGAVHGSLRSPLEW
jgi:hypothetical protein